MNLRVLHAPPGLEDLGPWQARPDAVSFSTPGGAPTPLVFRVDLPGGEATGEALSRMEGWVAQTHAGLDGVPRRVEAALERAHGAVAFDVTGLTPADAWLTGQLATGAVDYGMGEKVKRALRGILDVATRLAWIETRIEGEFLARTRIGLSGDIDLVTRPLITPADLNTHCRAVAASRESKDAWLRILTLVTNVARQLAKFATNPAAAVAALPRAWAYIKRIIAEVRAL